MKYSREHSTAQADSEGMALTEHKRDTRVIEFDNSDELKYWVKFFETSKDELLAAISAVGVSAHNVKAYLMEKFDRE